LTDDNGEVSFTVRKAMNTNTIYVYPKPVAG
jgi:3'-phosphoadenosine 5'-phosphosulfate sulfotransferase